MEIEEEGRSKKNYFTISPRQAIYWKQHSGKKQCEDERRWEFFFVCSTKRCEVATEASSIELKSDYNGNIFLSFIPETCIERMKGEVWELLEDFSTLSILGLNFLKLSVINN